MKKCKKLIILILFLCMIPLVCASIQECKSTIQPIEVPCQITSTWAYVNCTNTSMQVFNITGNNIQNLSFQDLNSSSLCFVMWNITSVGSYYYIVSTGDSGQINIEVENLTGSIAITFFILLVAGVIIFLPFLLRSLKRTSFAFTPNIIADLILGRCCYVLGLFLMILNSAIIATIAESTGLNITKEMFLYMNIFGWAGYLFMFYLSVKTFFDVMKITKNIVENKRMGFELE